MAVGVVAALAMADEDHVGRGRSAPPDNEAALQRVWPTDAELNSLPTMPSRREVSATSLPAALKLHLPARQSVDRVEVIDLRMPQAELGYLARSTQDTTDHATNSPERNGRLEPRRIKTQPRKSQPSRLAQPRSVLVSVKPMPQPPLLRQPGQPPRKTEAPDADLPEPPSAPDARGESPPLPASKREVIFEPELAPDGNFASVPNDDSQLGMIPQPTLAPEPELAPEYLPPREENSAPTPDLAPMPEPPVEPELAPEPDAAPQPDLAGAHDSALAPDWAPVPEEMPANPPGSVRPPRVNRGPAANSPVAMLPRRPSLERPTALPPARSADVLEMDREAELTPLPRWTRVPEFAAMPEPEVRSETTPSSPVAPPSSAMPAAIAQQPEAKSPPTAPNLSWTPEPMAAADVESQITPLAPPAEAIAIPEAQMPACTCQGCPRAPGQSGATTICGVQCDSRNAMCNARWSDARRIPWSIFAQGAYVGPARREHVYQYYVRVDDLIDLVYMQARDRTKLPYVVGVGDTLRIESLSDEMIDREVTVQPDGAITLPLLGEVVAEGRTIAAFRQELNARYRETIRDPQITVTPITTNLPVGDVLAAVDARGGAGGQTQQVRVTPEGTIQAPGLGSVYVQGLTLDEVRRELEARYMAEYGPGLRITPLLAERAPSYVFMGGEVVNPGRYTLEGPTTVMQAIAMAGGWNVGGNTNQIVVFRRDQNWCLKATKIDLFKPLYGKDPCPVNDVWLRHNDLVLIPKRPISVANDVIELYMTRGVYSAFPINFVHNFTRGSTVIPVSSGP